MTKTETEYTSPSRQSSSGLWEIPDRPKQISFSSFQFREERFGLFFRRDASFLTVFQVKSFFQGNFVLWSEKLLMIWEHRGTMDIWVWFILSSDLMAPTEVLRAVWGFGNILPSPQMTPALLPWEAVSPSCPL